MAIHDQATADPGASGTPPVDTSRPGTHEVGTQTTSGRHERRDQVRWAAVWAGVVVALPVFLVLQLLFFSLSILDLGFNGTGQGSAASIVSAILGFVAFLVGGLLAGASASSPAKDSGALHGVLTASLGIVAILVLTLLGAGSLVGNLGRAAVQLAQIQSQTTPLQLAQSAAGWAALFVGLVVASAAVGGVVGAGMRRN